MTAPEPLTRLDVNDYGEIQVVMTPGIQGHFREWLAARGLYLFPIPVEDDLPTYGIGIREAVWDREGGSRP